MSKHHPKAKIRAPMVPKMGLILGSALNDIKLHAFCYHEQACMVTCVWVFTIDDKKLLSSSRSMNSNIW